MSSKGKLYLIPNLLATLDAHEHFAPGFIERIKHIRHFVVESEKEARRFLRNLIRDFDIDGSSFELLNEHSQSGKISKLLSPARNGFDIGLISDAGCPAIADPGSELVLEAHAAGIQVIPLVGPSSILMTLMASGMNGQAFCFHGYLPKENSARLRFIKDIEYHSRQFGYTQLFMDTPYRNKQVYEEVLKVCSNDTLLCIGMEITAESEYIQTLPVGEWKKQAMPDLHKRPCMFAISG